MLGLAWDVKLAKIKEPISDPTLVVPADEAVA
jgi:hypothetical protein